MGTPTIQSETRLLVAVAKAENIGTVLRVVDESLKRAAELRQQREARLREERLAEARRARAEEAERVEREHAERLSERHRVEAAAVVAERDRLADLQLQAQARQKARSADGIDLLA